MDKAYGAICMSAQKPILEQIATMGSMFDAATGRPVAVDLVLPDRHPLVTVRGQDEDGTEVRTTVEFQWDWIIREAVKSVEAGE